MLKSVSSLPVRYTFQPKSCSNHSKDSIIFFLVVAAFGIEMIGLDNPSTICVAGEKYLPGVMSCNVRLEGDEK